MRGNTVSIKGGVTRDCEVRRTQSGNNAVSWGLAWTQSRKDGRGGYEDVPHYFDVECWMSDRQLDSVQPQLVKGARCAVVDGHLEYQSWEHNGQKRSKVVVRVDDPINGMMLAPPRQQGGQGGYAPAQQQPVHAGASVYDDDIPF